MSRLSVGFVVYPMTIVGTFPRVREDRPVPTIPGTEDLCLVFRATFSGVVRISSVSSKHVSHLQEVGSHVERSTGDFGHFRDRLHV